MKHKKHLQDLLVQQGLAESKQQAQRLILAAQVRVDGEVVTQAGALVSSSAHVKVNEGTRFVSRGGLKLEGALNDFAFDPARCACIDVGASSGGFTDCLLQNGAASVVAVDVGYGQFDWKLRQDNRVTLFERTNIAKANPSALGAPFEVLVADLSFTSLARLAPTLAHLVGDQNNVLTLVKPQFELPKDVVKNGVVRSLELHKEALKKVIAAYDVCSLVTQKVSFSHLLGAKGNTEFWIWATKGGATATIEVEEVVRRAHAELLAHDEATMDTEQACE